MSKRLNFFAVFLVAFALGGGAVVNEVNPLEKRFTEQISHYETEDASNVMGKANVYIYKNGEKVAEDHNVLLEGQEAVVDLMTSTSTVEYQTIAVGNGSTPTASDSSLPGRIKSCGFSPKTDSSPTIASGSSSYNVSVTYTSTCTIDVNTTALEVGSGSYGTSVDTFSATGFGRTIPFEPDDQLTSKWQIIPSDPTT